MLFVVRSLPSTRQFYDETVATLPASRVLHHEAIDVDQYYDGMKILNMLESHHYGMRVCVVDCGNRVHFYSKSDVAALGDSTVYFVSISARFISSEVLSWSHAPCVVYLTNGLKHKILPRRTTATYSSALTLVRCSSGASAALEQIELAYLDKKYGSMRYSALKASSPVFRPKNESRQTHDVTSDALAAYKTQTSYELAKYYYLCGRTTILDYLSTSTVNVGVLRWMRHQRDKTQAIDDHAMLESTRSELHLAKMARETATLYQSLDRWQFTLVASDRIKWWLTPLTMVINCIDLLTRHRGAFHNLGTTGVASFLHNLAMNRPPLRHSVVSCTLLSSTEILSASDYHGELIFAVRRTSGDPYIYVATIDAAGTFVILARLAHMTYTAPKRYIVTRVDNQTMALCTGTTVWLFDFDRAHTATLAELFYNSPVVRPDGEPPALARYSDFYGRQSYVGVTFGERDYPPVPQERCHGLAIAGLSLVFISDEYCLYYNQRSGRYVIKDLRISVYSIALDPTILAASHDRGTASAIIAVYGDVHIVMTDRIVKCDRASLFGL